MSDLYKKLANARDSQKALEREKRLFINDVYTQLISIAFINETEPDRLPSRFILSHIHLELSEIVDLLKSLDIGVDAVKECNYSTSYGYYYEVTTLKAN